MASLLAIDLGLKTGLAIYGDDGRLRRYRSCNFGARSRLKRAIPAILSDLDELTWLVTEGDQALSDLWGRRAQRRGTAIISIGAQVWRQHLMVQRERRSGYDAKQHADRHARQIIAWSNAPAPTSLRHDAAEAILIGLWGVLEVGWLTELPDVLARGGLTAVGPFGERAAQSQAESAAVT
ncbi:MAG: hypothetical protein AAFS10_25105 [Myxococcota bacterium]